MVLERKTWIILGILGVVILIIGGMMLSNTSLTELIGIFQKSQTEYALQEPSTLIGYRFLNDNKVIHIWNNATISNYYFNVSSGIQLTNHYEDYWTRNIFCIGYYSGEEWIKIKCSDELNNFNKNIISDNETYVNATLWKDIEYNGYNLRLGIQYHLGLNDENLSISIYGKNLGTDIPFDLGFAWKVTDWDIPLEGNDDYLIINNSGYNTKGTYDLTFRNLEESYFKGRDTTYDFGGEFLRVDWNENLNYAVKMFGNGNQEDFYVALLINAGRFDSGVEKQTTFKWVDALVLGTNVGFVLEAPTMDPTGGGGVIRIDDGSVVFRDTSSISAERITEIGWFTDDNTEEGNFEVGLYASDGEDVPGEAGTLLYLENTNAKGTGPGWRSVSVNWLIDPSTIYWIGISLEDTATNTYLDRATSGGTGYDNQLNGDTLSDPYDGGSINDPDGLISIYAVYEEQEPCISGICRFSSGKDIADIYSRDSGLSNYNSGTHIKWDISDLCNENPDSINSAFLSLYIDAKVGSPDSDARVWLIRDQTWDESSSAATINGQTKYNQSNPTLSSTTAGTYTNISVLTQVQAACEQGDNMTIRYEDPDALLSSIVQVVDSTVLLTGRNQLFGNNYFRFRAREYGSNEPILYVNYSEETPAIEINATYPINMTYNETTGLVNFTCEVNSNFAIDEASFKITKYYGGWFVNRPYNITTYSSAELTSLFGSNTNFNMTSLVNLSNGYYEFECNATSGAVTNSSEQPRYMTGKGRILIHHAIHTEPDFNMTHLATFLNNLSNATDFPMEEFRFEVGGEVFDVMNATWREIYQDDFGQVNTFAWDYRMDQLICESEQGCSVVFDNMARYEINITFFNDSRGIHIHNMDWFNATEWNEGGGGGLITATTEGACPPGGCQPAEWWNQFPEFNEVIPRNTTAQENYEQYLATFIIESGLYPISYVAGWLWEHEDFSNWSNEIIPFSFNNNYLLGSSSDSIEPIEGLLKWTNSPEEIYNPDINDFLSPGDMDRMIVPCAAGFDYDFLNHSFELADLGTDVIHCYYDHTYTSITDNVESIHTCMNETRWGGSCEEDDMATLYPEIKIKYGEDVDLIQDFFETEDVTPPTMEVTINGDYAFITSSEELWNNPVLAIQNETKLYLEKSLDNGTLQWKVDISDYNALTIRAAGIDLAFNTGVSDISISSVTIIAPTTASPFLVQNSTSIFVNYTLIEEGETKTTGVTTNNITIDNSICSLVGVATYGSGHWTQECTTPDKLYGVYDLSLQANTSTSGLLNDTEEDSIDYSPTDSCTYLGSGDWEVDCSDDCVVGTPYNLAGNTLYLLGIGTFNSNANLYNVARVIKDYRCAWIKTPSVNIEIT